MNLIILIFLLSHGLNVIFGLVVFFITLKRYGETKIRLILLLSSLMITWSIVNFLLILPILFPTLQTLSLINIFPFLSNVADSSISLIDVISVINVLGSGIVVGLFILFIDNFEGEVSPIKTATAVSLILVCFFIGLASLGKIFLPALNSDVTLSSTILLVNDSGVCTLSQSVNSCLITMRWSPIPSLIIFPSVILCGIWSQTELRLSEQHALSQSQLKQLRFMKIGAILDFFIGPFFGFLGVVLVNILDMPLLGTYSSEIIGYLFISIGIFMIGLSYISYKQAAFLQPQRIEVLLVINEAGLLLLEYEFISGTIEGDTNLISGAITAISALMKESLGISSEVERIAFHEKELLLKFYKGVAFVLITSRTSSFLNNSLANFSEKFLHTFEKDLNSVQVNTETFEFIIPELRKSFGL